MGIAQTSVVKIMHVRVHVRVRVQVQMLAGVCVTKLCKQFQITKYLLKDFDSLVSSTCTIYEAGELV